MGTPKNLKKIEQLINGRETARDAWAMLVGRFIMAFGDIENVTLLALNRISSDPIMRTASSLPLAKWMELLTEILETKAGISARARADFIKSLASAKKLADMRNLIAHNPLVLEIYEHEQTSELASQDVIVSARNENKKITIKTIQKLVVQVEDCRTLLFDQYGRISYELNRRLPRRKTQQSMS